MHLTFAFASLETNKQERTTKTNLIAIIFLEIIVSFVMDGNELYLWDTPLYQLQRFK